MNEKIRTATTDYFAAAYLITRGHEVKEIRIAPGGEKKAEFLFEGKHADFDAYFYNTNRGNVDPLVLRDAYYQVKDAGRKAIRRAGRKTGRRLYA